MTKALGPRTGRPPTWGVGSGGVTPHTVEVHLFAAARAAVGASVVTVEAGSLQDVLDTLGGQHPAFAVVRPQCSLLVDGLAVPRDANPDLTPGTQLDVLPPFAGG
jgi:molybdopterin converting factor small subunit